jgi:hypothetical protein
MPDREALKEPTGGPSARLLRALIWAGVSLAPVAAVVVVLLGATDAAERFAIVLIAACVVLIGASMLVRSDPVLLAMDVEDRVAAEVDALRDGLREEFAAAARATHHRVRAMQDETGRLRAAAVRPVPTGRGPSRSCPSRSCPSRSCPSRSCPSRSCPSRSCPSGSCPGGFGSGRSRPGWFGSRGFAPGGFRSRGGRRPRVDRRGGGRARGGKFRGREFSVCGCRAGPQGARFSFWRGGCPAGFFSAPAIRDGRADATAAGSGRLGAGVGPPATDHCPAAARSFAARAVRHAAASGRRHGLRRTARV